MRARGTALAACGVVLASLVANACAPLTRLEAVPATATSQARVADIPNSRFYLDAPGIAAMNQGIRAALERERVANRGRPLPPAYMLALSGGGDDGAFGAGVLVGWSAHGDRPEFKVVTGTSTGAMAAPFAFLGPRYDKQLREIYTQVSADNIFSRRSILAAVGDDAMTDSAPLQATILNYLDDGVVAEIAREYEKGRFLLIATTNLDAARPVIWDIGAIAASRSPRARELIAKVILASAAVPGVFPPVLFDTELDGQRYQEMHVDGGAVSQTFLYPPALSARTSGVKRRRVAYIIRNTRLNLPWQQVNRSTIAIAGRAVSTLIASNGVEDINRIHATTRRDGVEFNLAFIGDDFEAPYRGPFNTEYMNAVFDYAYALGARGYPWRKTPPG